MKFVMERFEKEIHMIGPVFNVMDRKRWEVRHGKDTRTKAKEIVSELLSKQEVEPPSEEVLRELNRVMEISAEKYGITLNNLPWYLAG